MLTARLGEPPKHRENVPSTRKLESEYPWIGYFNNFLEAAQLSERQLEWVIGRNPFSQSTMWGEGYDFAPLYTACSGDIVGALSVGIQSRGENDAPYWPVQTYWTYKEVWVNTVARWIFLMRDLAGPALVEGHASSPVEFQETSYGQRVEVKPDSASGWFRAMLPEGKYTVRSGGEGQTRTFLPSGTYNVDLRPGRLLDYEVTKETTGAAEVKIKVSARGSGSHRFSIRTENLTVNSGDKELTLRFGVAGTVEWRARVSSQDTPWVAVVVPDDNLSLRKEVMGAAWED